ncbi:ImuA family protein [Paracoccus sp. (in: a-proteobacteria)]|uniref:ImuA family protein n=1 Tax=Paracoccus sp. TaxID=267 RepID=UPI00396CEEEC
MDLGDTDPFRLIPHRIHEVQGPGAIVFAIFQAVRHPGPVFWIRPVRNHWTPFPAGLPHGLPARLHLVRTRSETDLLWSAEEALRASVTGFVLAEPQRPLSLTAGRRLQLAAEAGGTTGLMLIREGAGSNATESRWHCRPVPAPRRGMATQRWARIKNKHGLLGEWLLDWSPHDAEPRLLGAAALYGIISSLGCGEGSEPF